MAIEIIIRVQITVLVAFWPQFRSQHRLIHHFLPRIVRFLFNRFFGRQRCLRFGCIFDGFYRLGGFFWLWLFWCCLWLWLRLGSFFWLRDSIWFRRRLIRCRIQVGSKFGFLYRQFLGGRFIFGFFLDDSGGGFFDNGIFASTNLSRGGRGAGSFYLLWLDGRLVRCLIQVRPQFRFLHGQFFWNGVYWFHNNWLVTAARRCNQRGNRYRCDGAQCPAGDLVCRHCVFLADVAHPRWVNGDCCCVLLSGTCCATRTTHNNDTYYSTLRPSKVVVAVIQSFLRILVAATP